MRKGKRGGCGKRFLIQLNEARVDPTVVVGYQRHFYPALNKAQVEVFLEGGAKMVVDPIDDQHTPEMIALLEENVRR